MILAYCYGMNSWVKACDVCIPGELAIILSKIYTGILIIVPLILIISGMATMAMAITKQKEEDVKKAQQLLVKKIVAGIIVFILLTLVRFLVDTVSNGTETSVINCFDALLNYETGDACKKDTEGCSPGTNYIDFNNSCIMGKATGAVFEEEGKIDTLKCFTIDVINCKCSNENDVPYLDGASCKCAYYTEKGLIEHSQTVQSNEQGTTENQEQPNQNKQNEQGTTENQEQPNQNKQKPGGASGNEHTIR